MARYLNSPQPKFFQCGNCGAQVPRKALACPDCGADDRTGLRGDEDVAASLGLPDDETEFSYDDFIKREFGGGVKPVGLHWKWWVTGVVLLIAMALGWALSVR